MKVVTIIEDIVLAVSMILVLALTFGNVIARYAFRHSLGFTEEVVVAVFVLISLLGAGVLARQDGGLVNLSLITDRVRMGAQKVMRVLSAIVSVFYALLLTYEGYDRVLADHTMSPIMHIPKAVFWSFVVLGGISIALHSIENCIDFCTKKTENEEVPE